jgi:hypothetical protein
LGGGVGAKLATLRGSSFLASVPAVSAAVLFWTADATDAGASAPASAKNAEVRTMSVRLGARKKGRFRRKIGLRF